MTAFQQFVSGSAGCFSGFCWAHSCLYSQTLGSWELADCWLGRRTVSNAVFHAPRGDPCLIHLVETSGVPKARGKCEKPLKAQV